MRRALRSGLLVLGVVGLLLPASARAAFEAPAPDPVALALGGDVAWPGAAGAGSGAALFEMDGRAELRLGALQWAGLGELQHQGAALAWPLRGLTLGAAGQRLALADYSEEIALLSVARPVAETGWGGGVAAGVARWGLPGAPARAVPLVVQIGAAPAAGLRLAGRLRTFVGAGARALEERLEAAMTWDAAPGWRLGAGCEARPAGTRVRAALECRPAPGLALRGGFSPGEGGVAFGVGLARGPLVLDVAQSRHPRLGALLAAGLSLRFGAGARRVDADAAPDKRPAAPAPQHSGGGR